MIHRIPSPVSIPTLESGFTLLETPGHRTTALHQVALAHLRATDGPAVWIDARNNAATYLLDDEYHRTPDLQISRAFTAYQHYELVRTLPRDVPTDASLVVLPCLTSLYRDEDVPDGEGEQYLESALAILDEVASVFDVPVLASCLRDTAFVDAVRDVAAKTITFERTGLGFRFESEDFQTTVYWGDGYFQTTIPYWVELYGAVDDPTPAETAVEQGLIAGLV